MDSIWQSYHDAITAIERQVDEAGDTLYGHVRDYGCTSEDRIRWCNETHEALVTACSGLHALARVAEEVRSHSRHLVVPKIATEAGDAPVTDMDQEGIREHSPSQPASVAQPPERKT